MIGNEYGKASDIPIARKAVTEEDIQTFRAGLALLFGIYPTRAAEASLRAKDDALWRDRALTRELDDTCNVEIRLICYAACDTGVPNEAIMALYLTITDPES